MQESVGSNDFLQVQLVEMLMCINKNDEALYWADEFALPDDKVPGIVLDLR